MQSKLRTLIVVVLVAIQAILPATLQATALHSPKVGNATTGADMAAAHTMAFTTAATCVVTKTGDSGAGTLRHCLLTAVAGTVITFDPSTFQPATPKIIAPGTPLPPITVDNLTIDGSSTGVILDGNGLQRGDGLVIQGVQGVIIRGLTIRRFPQAGVVILDGAKNNTIGGSRTLGATPLGQGNSIRENREGGLIIQDSGTTGNLITGNDILNNIGAGVWIKKFASQNTIGGHNVISGNSGSGIWISDADVANPAQATAENKVIGNTIGLDATGTISATFRNGGSGVYISDGAQRNIVGGQTAADRNVISNNQGTGVVITGLNTDGNRVAGNLIGTDVTGQRAFRNDVGVGIWDGAKANIIGGLTAGERNIISGNQRGLTLWNAGTTQNQIIGNFIGTDATGTKAVPNGTDGINIGDGAHNNVIGGATAAERNVISGNGDDGFTIQDDGTDNNRIIGNFIGTDVTGKKALGNTTNGILIIDGPDKTVVGGQAPGEGNVISGNLWHGILIRDPNSTGTIAQGNFIGVDVTGDGALGNGTNGVIILQSGNNLIGGATTAARNIISANGTPTNEFYNAGIWLEGTQTIGNKIAGNFIGTDSTGKIMRPNIADGVLLGFGASDNLIGGETPAERNLISGNGDNGIIVQNAETVRNRIWGNYIGTDVTSERALANANTGIFFVDGPKENEVGGNSAAKRNVISGNFNEGIILHDAGTTGNRVMGNFIGTDFSGKKAVSNGWSGIALVRCQNNTIGGVGSGEGNVISGNGDRNRNSTGAGLLLIGATANKILGNIIGVDVDGLNPLGNKHDGITLVDQASDNQIGDNNAGNVIGSNGDSGVWLEGIGTRNNRVSHNTIGTDRQGAQQLPNTNYGVYLGNGAISNTIGMSNTILYNIIAGVALSGTTTLGNKITRNAIHSNQGGQLLWLTPGGVEQNLRLTGYSLADRTLAGAACANCLVEIYANREDKAAGAFYLTTATATGGGAFSAVVMPPAAFRYLSALQIMPNGTTSQFANSLQIMTGFNLYVPVVTKDASGAAFLLAGSAPGNDTGVAVLPSGAIQRAVKSGQADLLSGEEQADARTAGQ